MFSLQMVVIGGWAAAVATGMTVVYSVTQHITEDQWSTSVSALYNALHRIAWAISVCWVIFACANGYGGKLTRFQKQKESGKEADCDDIG